MRRATVIRGWLVAASSLALCLWLAPGAGAGSTGGTAQPVFQAAWTSFPDYMDPQLSYTAEGWTAMYDTYIPLLTYRHASGKAGSEVIPGLAKALPRISNGGRTYTLFLRPGLRYSDGEPVRASDFRFAVERMYRLNSGGSPFYDDIVGARSFAKRKRPHLGGIDTDDRSGKIVIHLIKPRATFTDELALPFVAPVPSKTPMSDQSFDPPPATGPYVIADTRIGEGWSYERNPEWRGDDGPRMPQIPAGHVGRIHVSVVRGGEAQVNQLIDGRVDWLFDPPPFDRMAELEAGAGGTQVRVEPTLSTYYFWMNTRRAPFDNLKVRQAIDYAVDPEVLSELYEGQLAPTNQILPPNMPGYRKFDLYPHNMAKARRLIREADPSDRDITVWTDGESPNNLAGEYYQGVLRALGFHANLKVLSPDNYFTAIGSERTPNLDTGFADWFEDYPHPNDFFEPLLAAKPTPFYTGNFPRFVDPSLSRRVFDLEEEPRPIDEAAYARLDRDYMKMAPIVPYGTRTLAASFSGAVDLRGFVWNPTFETDLTSLRFKRGATATATAAALRPSPAPTISPARTAPGAAVTTVARLSTKVVRPVELQRLSGGHWVRAATGRTTKQGVYRSTFRAPAEPGSYGYRVVARKVSRKVGRRSTRLPALTSGVRTLRVLPPPVSLHFPPNPSGGVRSPDTGTKVTPPAEREALIQLFDATDGEHWTKNEGWKSSEEPCSWSGVFCNLDAQVTALYLDENNLSGEIPDSLGDLPKLYSLYLFHNQLSGPIPASLGRLENLTELDLNYNQLTGAIPASLGELGRLEQLDLGGNQLTGEIPASLGDLTNLKSLYLIRNHLSGAIPSSLGNLSQLDDLELFYNQLTGEVPSSLGRLESLESLGLDGNQLSGPIPASLGDLQALNSLSLTENQLSGGIPAALGDLASLESLYLSRNQLSGEIPTSLGGLAQLKALALADNQLTGAIPSALSGLTELWGLYVANNQLSGAIPSSLGNLPDLEVLDLSRNQLSGGIPASLGSPVKLLYLGMAYNQLSGPIPASLGNLKDLTELVLLHNQLTGPIPSSLGGLVKLEGLGLDSNQLSGEIPSSLEQLTNLQVLRLDENGCLWTGDATLTAWLEAFGFTPAASESAC